MISERQTFARSPAPTVRRSMRAWCLGMTLAITLSAAAHAPVHGGTAAANPWRSLIYLADRSNHRVQAVDPSTFASTAIQLPSTTAPREVAITPDGTTAFLTDDTRGTIAIDTATGMPGPPIAGSGGWGIAITPDGRTAYVNQGASVIPIDTATRTAGAAIPIGAAPVSPPNPCGYSAGDIAITPDGKTAYAVSPASNTVTAITIATKVAGTPIAVGRCPLGVAVGIDPQWYYVGNHDDGTVTALDLSTNTARFTALGQTRPYGLAATWQDLYVGNFGADLRDTSPQNGSTFTIAGATDSRDAAISPDGGTAYVTTATGGGLAIVHGGTLSSVVGPGGDFRGVAITPELLTAAGTTATATQGRAFSGTVATFTDPNTARPAADFGALIDWGDGQTGSGTISGSGGSFTAAGAHTYGTAGSFNVTVTLYFKLSRPAPVHTTIDVQPPPAALFPAMANRAYGGYVTAATLTNTGNAPATVRIAYFDQSGSAVGTGDSIAALPVNGSWTVRQDDNNSFPSTGGDAVQAGSAIVFSTQPIASFVNEFPPLGAGDATSYTGVQVPSGVGTTLYAPNIVNNAYGGYTTGIGLLNQGSGATDITITYRDGGGTPVTTQTVSGLAAHAYKALYSGDSTLALPAGFAGTATLTASQPLGAVVNETGPGGQFSSYDAVPAGGTTLNAPAALNNAFGGYNTGMGIQNTAASSGTVTVTYYDGAGAATTMGFPIAAYGYLGVYQGNPTGGLAQGAYTATIQSTLPLAAIVNEVAPPGAGAAQQSTSYNTFGSGSATLHLPLVENAGSDPWNTGEGIMNTGTDAITVTISYNADSTGAAVGTPQTLSLASHAFWGLYQPNGGLPAGNRATAVVTTPAPGRLAVVCNESNATTFMSYDGQ